VCVVIIIITRAGIQASEVLVPSLPLRRPSADDFGVIGNPLVMPTSYLSAGAQTKI